MEEKKWNPKFIKYMDFIINHPNYKGLPIKRREDGTYSWIAPKKGKDGLARIKWANEKMKVYGISPDDSSPYARLMFLIHPTKKKICQICGKEMSLYYIYANSSFLKCIYKEYKYEFSTLDSIYDIVNKLLEDGYKKENVNDFLIYKFKLEKINKIAETNKIIELCEEKCRNGESKLLGPGAMSNFPDRFDGFHSYNRCCRSKEDKGRSALNLRSYGKDRRAYEYWSDGNIHAANQFMDSLYFFCISADHVGPISLGFVHDSNYLRPLSVGDNSAKRDKLSYKDINTIIEIENKTKVPAISWFSLYLWKYIKDNYKAHKENINYYRDMLKQNMSNYMFVLWYIVNNSNNKGKEFLIEKLLKPKFDCFNYNYTMNNSGKIIKREVRHKTDSSKNEMDRLVRIAFESVEDFHNKDNRSVKPSLDTVDYEKLEELCKMIIKNQSYEKIYTQLVNLIEQIENKLIF